MSLSLFARTMLSSSNAQKDETLDFKPDALSKLTQKIQDGLARPANGAPPMVSASQARKTKSEKKQVDGNTVSHVKSKRSNSGDLPRGKSQSVRPKASQPTSKARGKMKPHDGQILNQRPGEKGKGDVNSIKLGSKTAKPLDGTKKERPTIEDELLALGGTEEDLQMINGIPSDSEFEDDAHNGGGASMGKISRELQDMVKELGFDDIDREDISDVEDDNEHGDEQTVTTRQIAPRDELVRVKSNGTAIDAKIGEAKGKAQSRLVFSPQTEWHAAEMPALPISDRKQLSIPLELSDSVHDYAKSLLEKENRVYSESHRSSSSAHQFYSTIMSTGTLSDKISALTLSVQESPVHNMKALESLVGLAKKRSRGQAVEVLGALKDLFGAGNLLPSNRKLRNFANQVPLSTLFEPNNFGWKPTDPLPSPLKDIHLIAWAYEDWLKSTFFEVLKTIEGWCNDEVVFARGKAVDYVCQLLKEKPEQEANLLRLLVNKLGDPDKKIASKTSFNILQLQTTHPAMKQIIISAVESDVLFRPGQSLHAQYYATITLNQTVLSGKEEILAKKLLDIYFGLFVKLLEKPEAREERNAGTGVNEIKINKKGQLQGGGGAPGKKARKKKANQEKATTVDEDLREKMLSAILTGVNRAIPFNSTNDETFEQHLDTLYRVTHSSNLNTSIQALMLIQQLNGAHQGSVDRFYRTLYESLLDSRLLTSSKQALYLNLLYKALRSDLDQNRVKAFAKRLLQVVAMHQPSFTCGTLYLIRELESVFLSLPTFIDQAEEDPSDDEETFQDVPESPTSHDQPQPSPTSKSASSRTRPQYDGRKRDPLHANASVSTLWELHPLLHHYHPSVSIFASRLLTHDTMPSKPDLSLNTLIHFLDRFVYKNPKAAPASGAAAAKGPSIMQPLAAGNDKSSVLVSSTSGRAGMQQPVNSEAFWKQESEKVSADEVFFHRYFATLGRGKEKAAERKRKKKKDGKGEKDGSDDEGSEDEDEVWKALIDSRPELDEGSEASFGDDAGSELEGLEDDDDDDDVNIEGSDDGGVDVEPDDGGGDVLDIDDENSDDALLNSDDELPSDLDQALQQEMSKEPGGKRKASGSAAAVAAEPESKRGKKRRRLKNLPTFASAEDYASMIDDGVEE